MQLKHKVVVITGSAGGFGRALAEEFYRQGCHLALIDKDHGGLVKVKNALERVGQKISIHRLDVTLEHEWGDVRLAILQEHRQVDIVVNNAGIAVSQYFEQLDLADYKQVFDTNFWGTVYGCKLFLPDLKTRPESRLVNIISQFAFMGFPGKSAYGSSKSAIAGLAQSLKTELDGTPVRVCLVIPPPLNTGIVRNNKHIDDEKKENEARFLERNGMRLDKAARLTVRKIQKGKFRIVIGAGVFFTDLAVRWFPTLMHRLIGKRKKKFDFV